MTSRRSRSPASSLNRHAGIAIIALTYCILAASYAVLTPPWESPDEPAHYRYVEQLAQRWRPPPDSEIRQQNRFSKDHRYISSNYEWYQPALGYLPGALVYDLIQWLWPSTLPQEIPPLNPRFGEHSNLFVHQNKEPLKVWSGQEGLLILRVTSSFLGLLPVFAAYRMGRELGGKELGLTAAGWIAFLPQFSFITASLRSDTMANAVGALVCLVSIEILMRQVGPAKFGLLGSLIGLGVSLFGACRLLSGDGL